MRANGSMSCALALVAVLVAAGCSERVVSTAEDGLAFSASSSGPVDAVHAQDRIAELNEALRLEGSGMAVIRAELSLSPKADAASPNVVIVNDRQLRLSSRWVPGDVRRLADGNNITHANFEPLMFATAAGPASAAIDASFATWDAQPCTDLSLVKRTLPGNVFPSALLGFTGFVNDPFAADVATVGFLPGFLFDLFLGPGSSSSVLGVTWTLAFVDATGAPTDLNGDGRDDTAIKEVWYNNDFAWSTTGVGGVDIETTALHENGHGLELGHFGRLAVNLKQGRLTVSPRAVMNAIILNLLRTPLGTDVAGFCGNFANWPD